MPWTFINNNNLAIPTFQVIKYVERLWLCISSSSIKVPYIELEAHRNCYWLHFYHSKDIKFTRKRRGQKPSKDQRFSLCRLGLKTAPRASNFFPNKCDPSMNTPSIYVQDRYEGNSFIFHTCRRFSYASWSIWLFFIVKTAYRTQTYSWC